MDNDVSPPSAVIAGVPAQFDELVGQATARDPADRYADAQDMAAELDAIVDELGLPPFRVPAPRNSAQHTSASLYLSQARAQHATTETTARPPGPPLLAPRQHTRELTRDEWQPQEPEYEPVSGQFAGIDLDEFYWARQRAKRALLFWVVSVLTLTGLIAAAAWTLGGNIGTLI
jgi:serine/threonine-protein kinase